MKMLVQQGTLGADVLNCMMLHILIPGTAYCQLNCAPSRKARIMDMPPPSWYDVNILAVQPRLFAAYVTMLSCPVFLVCARQQNAF